MTETEEQDDRDTFPRAPESPGPLCACGGPLMRSMLRGKIHRATVTEADLEYEGSISIDESLMQAAGIVEWEHVHVLDVTNGARLETYAITAPAGSGKICINGAAAHLVQPGDLVIIVAYETVADELVAEHRPRIVHVDEQNRVVEPRAPEIHAAGQRLAEVRQ